MLVQELIDKLQELPRNMPVIVQTSNVMEQGQSHVDVTGLRTGHYRKESTLFRDSFDYEYYKDEIWIYAAEDDKKSELCLVISG